MTHYNAITNEIMLCLAIYPCILFQTLCVYENSEGLSSATNPKPEGLPSHCLLMCMICV